MLPSRTGILQVTMFTSRTKSISRLTLMYLVNRLCSRMFFFNGQLSASGSMHQEYIEVPINELHPANALTCEVGSFWVVVESIIIVRPKRLNGSIHYFNLFYVVLVIICKESDCEMSFTMKSQTGKLFANLIRKVPV